VSRGSALAKIERLASIMKAREAKSILKDQRVLLVRWQIVWRVGCLKERRVRAEVIATGERGNEHELRPVYVTRHGDMWYVLW
jgi:hypothetical protein